MVKTLLELKFPTTMAEVAGYFFLPYMSRYTNFATIIAAIEGNIDVFDILIDHKAIFPKLDEDLANVTPIVTLTIHTSCHSYSILTILYCGRL